VTESVVSLSGVSKIFLMEATETHALANIDFKIERGEYVAVVGPSGSGKSTLLSILGLLDVPTLGQCRFSGVDAGAMSVTERARVRNREIGFVFQSFNLIGDLTVTENVDLALVYGGVPRRERQRLAADALERVGMRHRANHYPAQVSGGEQQRVAIARAIVRKSNLLLADEPTGNLDTSNGEAVMDLIENLNRDGTAVCLVTHEERHANRANRKVRMIDGRIVSATQ
jgi:putative ABC transport system ATP-binding protein